LKVERFFINGMFIEQIFTSPGHNYYGHHGQPPDDFPLVAADRIECVAGHGIRGDRFFDYRDNYKGQITFFSREVFDLMAQAFGLTTKSPGVLRRNVIVSGIDLTELIGADFELQGVQFHGTAHCQPCYWMDTAFAPGAEKFLAGRGGLRARILTNGRISVGEAQLKILQPAPAGIP
jgi:MOSC domain-containing protein YiiM